MIFTKDRERTQSLGDDTGRGFSSFTSELNLSDSRTQS
jgi:hypothetical protein